MLQPRPRAVIPTWEGDAMSLSGQIRECLQYLATVRGYSRATVENYDRTYHQFLSYSMARGSSDSVRHFNTSAVLGFCTDLGERGVLPNTILNKLHGLSTLARFLMKKQDRHGRPLLASNPTMGFERPVGTKPATKFLHQDELRAFLAVHVSPELDLARHLLLDTGVRCLEAVEANVRDLNEVDGACYLTLRVKGRRQEGAEPASIPLSPALADQIRAALQDRGSPKDEAPLLVDQLGKAFTRMQLTCAMIRIGKKAGITRLTTSPHRLRHTGATVAFNAGVDRVTLAAMLNHRGLRHVERYVHLVPGALAKGRATQHEAMAAYVKEGASG